MVFLKFQYLTDLPVGKQGYKEIVELNEECF